MLPEWMIVAVFYMHGMPVQADANLLDPSKVKTEVECKAVIPKYLELMRERYGFDTTAECVRIYPAPAPAPKKPHDPASEVRS